jgi:hypothetical protein
MNVLPIIQRHPRATLDHIGIIPDMLSWANPKPAREQLNDGYRHGGGWHPQSGFALERDDSLKYPGDPRLIPLFEIPLREERIVIYEHGYVAVIQPDRTFEVCRMD